LGDEKMKRTIRNKKGMEGWLTNLLLGIIIVGGISAGFSLFATELVSQYTDQNTSTINLNFVNNSDLLAERAENMSKSVQAEPGNILDAGLVFIKGSFKAILMVLSSVDIFTGLLNDMTRGIGLPAWFTSVVYAGAFLVFVMAVIGWLKNRWG